MTRGPLFGALPAAPPVQLHRGWLPRAQACHDKLLQAIPWERHTSPTHGTAMPRRECWYSMQKRPYVYNGQTYRPHPLQAAGEDTRVLRWLLSTVNAVLVGAHGENAAANAVFCNHYRVGHHHISWHADDVAVLGPTDQVVIASLSVGGRRRFQLRHRGTQHTEEWSLGDGDLLVMGPRSQSDWVHRVAKTAKPVQSRINLTFRRVF